MSEVIDFEMVVLRLLAEMKPELEECEDVQSVKPIQDLGCDSQDDVDFACAFEEDTGLKLEPSLTILFCEKNGRSHLRTISEVIEFLKEYCTNKEQ